MSDSKDDPVEVVKPEEDAPVLDEYLHGTRLVALTVSLLLGMFLVALDNVSMLNLLWLEKTIDFILPDHHWYCDPQNHR